MNDYAFTTAEEIKREVRRFKNYLKREDMTENTVTSYIWTLNYFLEEYHTFKDDKLLAYKSFLMENFAPATTNQRIQALNKYITWNNIRNVRKLKSVKIQQKPYLENVISMTDYTYLKRKLKQEPDLTNYFLIWGIGCTGARISEILKVKVENIADGFMDLYGKGRKNRRIYFIKAYQKEALEWCETVDIKTGYIFLKQNGEPMTIKGVEKNIKSMSKKFGIEEHTMYPHSFRHMFGKNFYDKTKDLPLLADIMGHASLETTRIYTRRTALEQRSIIEKTVKW